MIYLKKYKWYIGNPKNKFKENIKKTIKWINPFYRHRVTFQEIAEEGFLSEIEPHYTPCFKCERNIDLSKKDDYMRMIVSYYSSTKPMYLCNKCGSILCKQSCIDDYVMDIIV